MKRVLSFVLSLTVMLSTLMMLGISTVAEPELPEIILECDKGVLRGEYLEVNVNLKNNPGLICLNFDIVYDANVLNLERVENTGLLEGYTPAPINNNPYTLRWNNSTATDNNTATGTIAKLTFKALDDADFGDTVIRVSFDGEYNTALAVNPDDLDADPQVVEVIGTEIKTTVGEGRVSLGEDVEIGVGQTFTVDVIIENNPGIIVLNCNLEYDDSAFELVSVKNTKLLNGYTAPPVSTHPNPVTLRWSDGVAENNNRSNGIVATVTFTVLEQAKEGNYNIEVNFDGKNNCALQMIEENPLEDPVEVVFMGSAINVGVVEGYDVVYNANGGEKAPEAQRFEYGGSTVISSAVPEKEGYNFLGWATSSEASLPEYVGGETYAENADLTLYAVWEIKRYTVSFDANGGENAPENIGFVYGEGVTIPSATPAKEGYNFLGWATSADAKVAEYVADDKYSENADLTLYAVWEIKRYTASFDANGGENAPENIGFVYGEGITIPNVTPEKENYDFLGWALNSTSTKPLFFAGDTYSKNNDVVFYAVWALKTYTVTFDMNGATISVDPLTKTHGVDAKLPYDINRKGYIFLGWATTKDATEPTYTEEMMYTDNAPATLYAVWEKTFIYGDVDGDDDVDEQDAVRLGRYLAGWNIAIIEDAADVAYNGSCDEQDSVRLGRYLAGWTVNLGPTE